MLIGRRKYRRSRAKEYWRLSSRLISIGLFAGVGGLISCGQVNASESATMSPSTSPSTGQFWEFASESELDAAAKSPTLFLLPPIEESQLGQVSSEDGASPEAVLYRLPKPEELSGQPEIAVEQDLAVPELAPAAPPQQRLAIRSILAKPIKQPELPKLVQLSEQEKLLRSLLAESANAATGVPTNQRLDELAKKKIQNAYALASRGSLYVARKELVEVLRMISQAKDSQQGSNTRSQALAAGQRALREAEDFVPQGTQLEADLEIDVICASHRTPIAGQLGDEELLPSQLMGVYLRYAQLKLAISVAGEPAGSMALHALGKLDRQLDQLQTNLDDRRAIAYQQAALLAHNQNHLAAHELAVLLATSGHYEEAHQLFEQVASLEPNAVVFRNLARVQEKLGRQNLALASRSHATQLTQQGATGTHNVQWVSPQEFTRSTAQPPRFSAAQLPVAQGQTPVRTAQAQLHTPPPAQAQSASSINQVPLVQGIPLPGTRQAARPVGRR